MKKDTAIIYMFTVTTAGNAQQIRNWPSPHFGRAWHVAWTRRCSVAAGERTVVSHTASGWCSRLHSWRHRESPTFVPNRPQSHPGETFCILLLLQTDIKRWQTESNILQRRNISKWMYIIKHGFSLLRSPSGFNVEVTILDGIIFYTSLI